MTQHTIATVPIWQQLAAKWLEGCGAMQYSRHPWRAD
uniref:Uncharacterized protein n=1 Tax=Anguilla anguilla TaxID=7936 RepID=A0A0E9VXN3_ANGAN